MHLILPAEMVNLIDQFAQQLGREAGVPWAEPTTRTEAIKELITDGLKKRGLLK